MRIHSVFALAAISLLYNCSNLGLLDKLENPGGSKSITYTNNNYIFVSSWVVDGSINPNPYVECQAQTGMARADCACTKAAEFNGRLRYAGHKFYAWLSSSATPGPAADAVCRLQGLVNGCGTAVAMPWFNTQGQQVAASLGAMVAALSTPVRYSESGFDMTPDLVWTGTGPAGTFNGTTGNDCSSWTSTAAANGTVGSRMDAAAGWTNSNSSTACNTGQRLYCIAAPN